MRLVWGHVRAAENVWKNLQGYSKLWFSPLHNATMVPNRLALPSTASFFSFSWHKFFNLAKQKYFHSAEHGLGFPSMVPFCMSFLCSKCDSTPTIPPLLLLFIHLTHLEHQKHVSAGDSVAKCVSSAGGLQVPRRREGHDERHMRHYTDRVGMGPNFLGQGQGKC